MGGLLCDVANSGLGAREGTLAGGGDSDREQVTFCQEWYDARLQ